MNENVSLSFTNKVLGQAKLERYYETLNKINIMLKGSQKGANLDISAIMNKNQKETSNFGNSLKKAFNFSAIIIGTKRLASTISNQIELTSSYIENLNLLDVAMGDNEEQITKFINNFSEMYNLDESSVTKTVGTFKQLANAMGIVNETGTKMSEVLTQLSLDASSLYNTSFENAVSKFQSGLAGQTKPLRSFGADITENSLALELQARGINRNIDSLSFAEKRLVIVMAVMRQLTNAQNDFGRTSESMANQIKIMSEQWDRLSRAMGNLFFPIVKKILPYINAILMVLTEIINTIASLLGFSLEGEDYFSSIDDNIVDFGNSLDSANESAKRLKSGLRGFDKLNVITSPSTGGTSGTGGIGGGIDKSILDEFDKAYDNYKNNLMQIETKASQIRDKIMDILGFSKLVNEETGEIKWEYQGWETTAKNLWELFKKLSPQGKILAGIIATIITTKTINLLKKFISFLDKTGLLGILKKIYSPLINFNSELKKMFTNVTNGNNKFTKLNDKIKIFNDKIKICISLVGNLLVALGGITIMGNAFEDMATNGIEFGNVVQSLIGLLTTFSGVMGTIQTLTNLFNTTISTGLLGGISLGVTALISLISWLNNSSKTTNEAIEENKRLIESYNQVLSTANETFSRKNSSLEYTKKLTDELSNYIDQNGRVKKSDEDRVNYILNYLNEALGTEYKLTNGLITLNGKIIKGKQQLQQEIKKQIALKKQEILLNAFEEDYANAIKETIKGEKEKNKWKFLLKQAELDYQTAIKLGDVIKAKSFANDIKNYKNSLTEAENYYQQYENKIKAYESLYEDSLKGSTEKTSYYIGILSESYRERTEFAVKTAVDNSNNYIENNLGAWTPKVVVEADTNPFLDKIERLKFSEKKVIVNADTTKIESQVNSALKNLNVCTNIKFKATSIEIGSTTPFVFSKKANGGIFSNGVWKPITQYASGGLPPVGQMFIAREKGPELVGKIGSNTAVMNNNQIVSSVASGVYNAVKSANSSNNNPQIFNFYLDENNKIASYTLGQLQDMAKSNGKPIIIGG